MHHNNCTRVLKCQWRREGNTGTENHCTTSQVHHAGFNLPHILQPPWALHRGKPSLLRLLERICKQSEWEGSCKISISNMRVRHAVASGGKRFANSAHRRRRSAWLWRRHTGSPGCWADTCPGPTWTRRCAAGDFLWWRWRPCDNTEHASVTGCSRCGKYI